MTEHPTPPPELVEQWIAQGVSRPPNTNYMMWFATQAASWGADMELEACCEHLKRSMSPRATIDYLRAARRPKPPSLKEQALEQLSGIETCFRASYGGDLITDTIRRALESLPND